MKKNNSKTESDSQSVAKDQPKQDVVEKKPIEEKETKKKPVGKKEAKKKEVENKEAKKKEVGEKEQTSEVTQKPSYFKKKDNRRRVVRGKVFIKCSYNNTIVTIADLNGAVLGWATAGSLGFRGAKKATPYAATLVSTKAVESTAKTGLREVDVFVKGVGGGREAAVRALGNSGLKVNSIKDTTPIPHNGCRSKKQRRV
jgi:small subunit ribosomal protein S11